jgi:hypothetical protein
MRTQSKNRLRRLYEKYCVRTEWNIGFTRASDTAIRDLITSGRLGPIQWCPRVSLLGSRADPFVWALDGEPRILYEEIDSWTGRGEIRSILLEHLSRRQRSRLEILKTYHLSYPFVMKWENVWYCMPECARSSGVDLYFWNSATSSWQLKRRLLDQVPILDGSLLLLDGIWYLFGTIKGSSSYDTLKIWWARSLEGEWWPHRSDPAKVDVRSARPGGALFEFEGRLYRPAQDCSDRYGGALTINRIEVLTPNDFRETTVSRVRPDRSGPYPHGLHTLAVYGDRIVFDGKRTGFNPWLPVMKAARRVSRLTGH